MESYEERRVHMELGPAVMHIESVKGCPFSCAMCHFQKTQPKNMPRELLAKLEPFFPDLEVMAIHGQGEPLLGDVGYFVEQSVEHGCVLHMNSTGFLLTKAMANLLSDTRFSIRFSIHAGTPDTYRRIMGHDLDKIKRNVSYLVQRIEGTQNQSDLWFSLIVMKENINEIGDFLHLAHDCGIRSVRFVGLIANWQSIKGVWFRERDFKFNYFEQSNRKVIEQFSRDRPKHDELARQLGIKIEYGPLKPESGKLHTIKESLNSALTTAFGRGLFPLSKVPGACLAPWFGQLVVSRHGIVRLCCSTNYTLGDLGESSLDEIWNSAQMKAVRKSFAQGDRPRVCGYCQGFGFGNYPNNSFAGIPR